MNTCHPFTIIAISLHMHDVNAIGLNNGTDKGFSPFQVSE